MHNDIAEPPAHRSGRHRRLPHRTGVPSSWQAPRRTYQRTLTGGSAGLLTAMPRLPTAWGSAHKWPQSWHSCQTNSLSTHEGGSARISSPLHRGQARLQRTTTEGRVVMRGCGSIGFLRQMLCEEPAVCGRLSAAARTVHHRPSLCRPIEMHSRLHVGPRSHLSGPKGTTQGRTMNRKVCGCATTADTDHGQHWQSRGTRHVDFPDRAGIALKAAGNGKRVLLANWQLCCKP